MLQKAAHIPKRDAASRAFEIIPRVVVACVFLCLVAGQGDAGNAGTIHSGVARPSLEMKHHGGLGDECRGTPGTLDGLLGMSLEVLQPVIWYIAKKEIG